MSSPILATFPKRVDGREVQVSYRDYFMQRYNLRIQDLEQPMLVALSKERDRRGGRPVRILKPPNGVLRL